MIKSFSSGGSKTYRMCTIVASKLSSYIYLISIEALSDEKCFSIYDFVIILSGFAFTLFRELQSLQLEHFFAFCCWFFDAFYKNIIIFALSLFCRNFFIKSMSCFWTPMQEISLNRSWWTSQLVYICKFTVLFQIFTDSIMEMKGIRPKNIEEKPKRIDSTSFKKLSIFPFYRIHRHICSLLQVCQANT